MMILLVDSNIIIYSVQKENGDLRKWLKRHQLFVSPITKVEVLGYHKITSEEITLSERFFSICREYPINQAIIEAAITHRQQKSMSLGDALIAGTATANSLTIATANTKDFAHIKNVNIINPLEL